MARYARPALAEQRENRLTQVFAGVLAHCDGLALDLARDWFAPYPEDTEVQVAAQSDGVALALTEPLELREVRPQRPTYGGQTVDLELRFGRPGAASGEDVVIWVEVKHGASPHEHQLTGYVRDIGQLGARASAVVLLAPRQSYPFEMPAPPPDEVRQRRWQQTAGRCARWARGASGVPRFLVDEFLDYLQEESLMDPEVLTPVHLVALAEYPRAAAGLATICEVASGYVDRHWNERSDYQKYYGKPAYGVGYWEAQPAAPRGEPEADWDPFWWDWVVRESDISIPSSRGGVPVFAAGLTSELTHPIVTPKATAWAAKLADEHGFLAFSDSYDRVNRVAYPEEVLVGRSLQQQAESLGAWVVETFRGLQAAGPPPQS